MKSIEWIDRLKSEQKIKSDRQLGLRIGMSAQTISKHRNGKLHTLDDEYAHNLERALNLPPGSIVADQHGEREKNPEVKAVWQRLAKLAGIKEAVTNCLPFLGLSLIFHQVITEVQRYHCILC